MKVGILAVQGCIEPHFDILSKLPCETIKVRDPQELESVDRLIMPGGESSSMLLLLEKAGLPSEIIKFGQTRPVWGICAGAILASQTVTSPQQTSLNLAPVQATRNYYGSQLESFETQIEITNPQVKMAVQFIRAPLLKPLSDKVQVRAIYKNEPVMLVYNRIMLTSFHVELGSSALLHQYFLRDL